MKEVIILGLAFLAEIGCSSHQSASPEPLGISETQTPLAMHGSPFSDCYDKKNECDAKCTTTDCHSCVHGKFKTCVDCISKNCGGKEGQDKEDCHHLCRDKHFPQCCLN